MPVLTINFRYKTTSEDSLIKQNNCTKNDLRTNMLIKTIVNILIV
jgi:hypothetical protein